MAALARYCRVRTYLVSARNHGVRPIDAIHTALTGMPRLPTPVCRLTVSGTLGHP